MLTPYDTRLPPDLQALKEEIEGHARAYGLDFYETIFEVIDPEDLNEIAAYGGFPTRYPHWSFGMAYEELRKGYDYGLSKIYEMVINNDPCYAYLMRSNPTVDQKLVMAHVYGHCLAPDTKVETRSGVRSINEVKAGDEVLTHTGVCRPVRFVNRRRHRGRIRRITISGHGEPVRITEEHPVYVLRPSPCVLKGRSRVPCRPNCQVQHKCSAPRPYETYQLEWLPAGELRAGDFVVLPHRRTSPLNPPRLVRIPIDKIHHRRHVTGEHRVPVGPELAKLLGYFIAEGNAQRRGLVGFGFHRDEGEFQAEVARLAEKLFHVNVGHDDYPATNARTIRFNSLEIAGWLREAVGTSASTKSIPEMLLDAEVDAQQECLRGLFNGDGYYTATPGRRSGTLSLATVSEQLAYQVRTLCARWGIQTSIYPRKRPGRQKVFELVWSGSSAHKFSEMLYGRAVIGGNRSFERSWSDSDFLYQQVRKIEEVDYDGEVFNFSVEEDESYTLASGMVVHNCDFFKNNAYFAHTNRKMMDEMANHGSRIRHYVERYGEDEVETFLDRCMSIDDLIDIHSLAIRRRDTSSHSALDAEAEADTGGKATRFKSKDYMDEYINPRKILQAEEEENRKAAELQARNFPEHPEKDVLLFLLEHAPLKSWQHDVLEIIRDEAYYFMPQGQTKVINEGWACADRNTILISNQGLVRLGEVVDQRRNISVSDGDNLRRVCDWVRFPNRKTISVRTRRGLELTGSVTHRVLSPSGEWRRLDEFGVGDPIRIGAGADIWAASHQKLDWKQPGPRLTLQQISDQVHVDIETVIRFRRGGRSRYAEKLAPLVGEYVAGLETLPALTSRRKRIQVPEIVDERLGAFLGYMVGDGHISEVKRTLGLTTGDDEQAETFSTLMQTLFGLEPTWRKQENRWRIRVSSRNLQEFLQHLGLETGVAARRKTVPDVILQSPKSVVAAFLRAYYDCDGYAGPKGVILSTSSTEMSKQVQLLLLNFGVLSTRRPHKDGCWHVHTMGKSAAVFLREIGFGLTRKQSALRRYVEDHRWFKEESWDDEIVSIEHGRGDVYDITVEETHRYAAQGFINHNSFWHTTIMTQKALQPSEVIDYAEHHSGTVAMHGARLNPYKLGLELLRDIEMRWNTGRFGKEWDECEDQEKRRKWDKQLGLGRQKIFEVRRIHNDITFIDTFLTPEFCVENKLFTYAWQEQAGVWYIDSKDFDTIKKKLLFSLTNFGKPWIVVTDGNYRNRGELLLQHRFNGVELRMDHANDVLVNLQFIWGRPVHLQTMVDDKPTMLSFDGTDHGIKTGGEIDDARKNPPAKTR